MTSDDKALALTPLFTACRFSTMQRKPQLSKLDRRARGVAARPHRPPSGETFMQRSSSSGPFCASSGFAVSLLAAALLAACGGGGSGTGSSDSVVIDDATATTYAANSAQIGGDTLSVADDAVAAAQAMIAAGADASASDDRATAMAADAGPLPASIRACPGGGSATVTVTGGTPQSELNGQLESGEIYQVSFAACTGAAGFGQIDGMLSMTVESASGDSANGSLDLAMAASNLSLTLPRGGAVLNGATERQYGVSTDSDGTVHLSSHFISPSLTLATHYNARSSSFTLSNADILRTATLVGGALQSSTINGHHSLVGTLPNASFNYSVATSGGVTYAADGTPASGRWTITLPTALITVSVANGTATIAIDDGKDGTIDRTITIPVGQLAADAG
jgi:hypothetical protein